MIDFIERERSRLYVIKEFNMANGVHIVYLHEEEVNAIAGESSTADIDRHPLSLENAERIRKNDIKTYGFEPGDVLIIPNDSNPRLGEHIESLKSRMRG